MFAGQCVRRHVLLRILNGDDRGLGVRIESQSRSFGITDHPLQRQLREPRFCLDVATAYIAMRAGKPHLNDIEVWLWRRRPQVLHEVSPPLIQCHGVSDHPND